MSRGYFDGTLADPSVSVDDRIVVPLKERMHDVDIMLPFSYEDVVERASVVSGIPREDVLMVMDKKLFESFYYSASCSNAISSAKPDLEPTEEGIDAAVDMAVDKHLRMFKAFVKAYVELFCERITKCKCYI